MAVICFVPGYRVKRAMTYDYCNTFSLVIARITLVTNILIYNGNIFKIPYATVAIIQKLVLSGENRVFNLLTPRPCTQDVLSNATEY